MTRSRLRRAFALALLMQAAGIASSETPPRFETVLDRNAPALLNEYAVPGVAIAVIEQQRVVALRGFGWADAETRTAVTADTLFNVGSISKALTAWGIMRLVERGKLALDRPVSDYLKRWQLPASAFDSSAVTLARVLSHTAGISAQGFDGVEPSRPRANALDLLNGPAGSATTTLVQSPGTGFLYSGANYLIAALVIEDVSGLTFDEYMSREVFGPLGMRRSTFELPRDDAGFARAYDAFEKPLVRLRYDAHPAAALTTSVRELARFAVAAFPARSVHGDLRSETLERMQTAAPNSVWAERDPFGPKPAYGLGFNVRPEQFRRHPGIGHGGSNSGWESFFEIIPATGDGIVILTNGSNGSAVIAAIVCAWQRSGDRTAACPTIEARIPLLARYRLSGVDGVLALYETLRARPDSYDISVSQLNSLGYQVLRAGDIPGAVRIFERNSQAYPLQWNVFDSLAEAQALAGQRTEAIANYQRSLELNPYNDNGQRMLGQLGVLPK